MIPENALNCELGNSPRLNMKFFRRWNFYSPIYMINSEDNVQFWPNLPLHSKNSRLSPWQFQVGMEKIPTEISWEPLLVIVDASDYGIKQFPLMFIFVLAVQINYDQMRALQTTGLAHHKYMPQACRFEWTLVFWLHVHWYQIKRLTIALAFLTVRSTIEVSHQ